MQASYHAERGSHLINPLSYFHNHSIPPLGAFHAAVHIGALEVAVVGAAAGEVGVGQVGAAQFYFLQVGVLQVGAFEVGFA